MGWLATLAARVLIRCIYNKHSLLQGRKIRLDKKLLELYTLTLHISCAYPLNQQTTPYLTSLITTPNRPCRERTFLTLQFGEGESATFNFHTPANLEL